MKKISEIMNELGFKKDAPDSVKEAFIKHLIYVSTGTKVPDEKEQSKVTKEKKYRFAHEPEQLCFDVKPEKKVI
jgi:hypothetical protein